MDRMTISALAHRHHPVAAPLADSSVAELLARALPADHPAAAHARVLDLGCGEAAWLVRALTGHPGRTATGVDADEHGLARAAAHVRDAGLGERLTLTHRDAREFTAPHPYDLVLSVGASHAFGGLLPTLRRARTHLAPGGRLVVGEGFWAAEPNQVMLDGGFAADEYADLATTVDQVLADGWTPVHGHVSTLAEWDAYEWAWTGAVADWALDHPDHPDAGQLAEVARQHRHTWLHGYREVLGFVTLVLRPTGA